MSNQFKDLHFPCELNKGWVIIRKIIMFQIQILVKALIKIYECKGFQKSSIMREKDWGEDWKE